MNMVYVDNLFRCHATKSNDTFREVENQFFNGKCGTFIEGYCYDDSKVYTQIYPWKPYDELAAAQTQYELDMEEAAAAYQEGVNSV